MFRLCGHACVYLDAPDILTAVDFSEGLGGFIVGIVFSVLFALLAALFIEFIIPANFFSLFCDDKDA